MKEKLKNWFLSQWYWWRNNRPRPIKRMKWWFQRAERGFSDEDWWNFDQYLALVIAEGCKKFQEDSVSWPGAINNRDEWLQILSKIENGFRQYTTILEVHDENEEDRIINEMKESGELLIKWFPAFWD